jgi:TPR repeat protein
MIRVVLILALTPTLAMVASDATPAPTAKQCQSFYDAKDFTQARDACTAAAEKGDVQSRYLLGRMYEEGDGVTKDEKTAAKWYQLAAEAGHAVSQRRLAGAYALGRGVEKNEERGRYWILQAAKNGDSRAMKQVALGYEMGIGGLPKDPKLAAEWRAKAEQSKQQNK